MRHILSVYTWKYAILRAIINAWAAFVVKSSTFDVDI